MPRAATRWIVTVSLLAVALVPVGTGCNAIDMLPLVTVESTLSEDFKTTDTPTIVIDTFNGSIDVTRGSDDQVQVDVTKRASGRDHAAAEAALNSIQVSMIQDDNTLSITAERLDRAPGNFGADVVIAVPADADLNLTTSNGRMISEQVTGPIEATSSNGKLEVYGGRGPLNLKTSNGGIEIEATDAVVDARTSNGRIEFRGQLAGEKQKFRTSNGRITLTLPDDAEFYLDAHTSNARVRCDFPIDTDDGRKRRRDLEGVVGNNPDPNCIIDAKTSNGSISIERTGK